MDYRAISIGCSGHLSRDVRPTAALQHGAPLAGLAKGSHQLRRDFRAAELGPVQSGAHSSALPRPVDRPPSRPRLDDHANAPVRHDRALEILVLRASRRASPPLLPRARTPGDRSVFWASETTTEPGC